MTTQEYSGVKAVFGLAAVMLVLALIVIGLIVGIIFLVV